MVLAKVLLNKLTNAEVALLCDSYDCGDFDFNIMPELIERDAKNRPAVYGYKDHELEKSKQKDMQTKKKRYKGIKNLELHNVTNSENIS